MSDWGGQSDYLWVWDLCSANALVVAYRLSPLKVTLSFEGNSLLLLPGCAFVFLGPMLAPLFVVRFGKPIDFWLWEFQICYPSLGELNFRTPHMFHSVGRRSAHVIGAILVNMFSALPWKPRDQLRNFFWYGTPGLLVGQGPGRVHWIFSPAGATCVRGGSRSNKEGDGGAKVKNKFDTYDFGNVTLFRAGVPQCAEFKEARDGCLISLGFRKVVRPRVVFQHFRKIAGKNAPCPEGAEHFSQQLFVNFKKKSGAEQLFNIPEK